MQAPFHSEGSSMTRVFLTVAMHVRGRQEAAWRSLGSAGDGQSPEGFQVHRQQ